MDSDFLVTYLDSIDEALLDYLDADEELSLSVVRRLRQCTTDLLDGTTTPGALKEEWPDWFALAGAYVATYGTDGLAAMRGAATGLRRVEEGEETVQLEAVDFDYLRALASELDVYPEMRLDG
jgi:hypothetical protein